MGSPAEGARDALPGQLLGGRYRIEHEVARDLTAHVFRARDERLDRPVAVKVLDAAYSNDPAEVQRFLDEARRAASEPNLAQVYDSGEEGGIPFLVMELLDLAPPPVDDDTTSVVATPSPAQAPPLAPGTVTTAPTRRGVSPLAIFGIVVLLGVSVALAAIVVMGFRAPDQPAEAASPTTSASATEALAAGKVEVPDTVGMSEAEAERAAGESGLAWRLEWRVDASKPAGVYDQDPAAGTVVDDGASFVMYAYRTK